MASSSWVIQNYSDLQAIYAGKWIVVANDRVVFADVKFERAYEKYREFKSTQLCEILLVDSGDASFYKW